MLLKLGERTLIGLSIMIGLTALLVIGGITHLLVVSRKDEIQIIKLVGGTDGYVMLSSSMAVSGMVCWAVPLAG